MFSRAPKAPAVAAKEPPRIEVACVVRDFFILRDVLFVRGETHRANTGDPRISVRLPDGSLAPVAHRPDDFSPPRADICTFCFGLPLAGRYSDEEILRMTLVLDYPAGRFEKGEFSQAAAAADAFLGSEGPFWEHVRSHPTGSVLEIGSRARSGISRKGLFPDTCSYTGLDIVSGENVDRVGDAHALSSLFPRDHFDAVFSVSVWEHLSMPWLVSLELNKVMKRGGLAMINTHQSWPSHEEPWDYFRFSNNSWEALFNAATGFEIVAKGAGIPCVMGASQFFPSIHASRVDWHYGYLATRCVVRKIGDTRLEWPVDPKTVATGAYPH